jgi:hypothetical protein
MAASMMSGAFRAFSSKPSISSGGAGVQAFRVDPTKDE